MANSLFFASLRSTGITQDRVESRFHSTEQATGCLAHALKVPLRLLEGCGNQPPTLLRDAGATPEKFGIVAGLALQAKGCGMIHQFSKHRDVHARSDRKNASIEVAIDDLIKQIHHPRLPCCREARHAGGCLEIR